MITIKVKKLRPEAKIPQLQTPGAAAADLHANYRNGYDVVQYHRLYPGEHRIYWTGISIEVPDGWEAQIRPRSGLAAKYGVSVVNSPGTIDSDYRGEIGVILINHGDRPFDVEEGDRIAQIIVKPAPSFSFEEVQELSLTDRGAGGMGSTGNK